MFTEVLSWLPSIKAYVGFPCPCSECGSNGFVHLETRAHQDSPLCCEHNTQYELSTQHKCWLPVPTLPHSPLHISDGTLTEIEIQNVSDNVETRLLDVVKVMEMEYSYEKAKESSRGLAHAVISDFATRENGRRYKLAQFLESAKFHNLSQDLLSGKLKSPASCRPLQRALAKIRAHKVQWSIVLVVCIAMLGILLGATHNFNQSSFPWFKSGTKSSEHTTTQSEVPKWMDQEPTSKLLQLIQCPNF